jgi:hypothetical protein
VAAAGDGLPAVPARRLPLISIGSVSVREGDDPESTTARVPFTIAGTVERRGTFAVLFTALDPNRSPEVVSVEISPGQTSGTIPVDYLGNTDPNPDGAGNLMVAAWAARGVMTDAYLGTVTVRDDDPLPVASVTVPKKAVKEGRKATWTIRIASPLRSDLAVDVQIVRGPAKVRALTGNDVPSSWLASVSPFPAARSTPLWKRTMLLYTYIPAGETSTTISVPIRKDGKREGREQLTLRFTIGASTMTRTIYVAASK